jgi:hypothetical protein
MPNGHRIADCKLKRTAFDLIGDLAFGQDFGCLDKGQAAPFVAAIPSGAQELTVNQMLKYYGLLPLVQLWRSLRTKRLGFFTGRELSAREENMKRAVEVVRRRVSRGPTADRKDFWVCSSESSYRLKHFLSTYLHSW